MLKLIRVQLAVLVFCLTVVLAVCGCQHKRTVDVPATYPVFGKVVSPRGNIPAGYRIKFTSPDPECSASSLLGPDGSFSLTTRYMSVACEGAVEGEYRVSLIPPLGLSNKGVPATIIPRPIRVEPKDNELTISF